MNTQKATLTTRKQHYISSFRKENNFHKSFSALIPAEYGQEMKAVVELRIYWPGSVAYAALWTFPAVTEESARSGTGKAGGGGYCKLSAAAGTAIQNAGIDLASDIHGRGESAVRDAVLAIAAAIGFPEARLFVAHG